VSLSKHFIQGIQRQQSINHFCTNSSTQGKETSKIESLLKTASLFFQWDLQLSQETHEHKVRKHPAGDSEIDTNEFVDYTYCHSILQVGKRT
jgi:hypothetical protein